MPTQLAGAKASLSLLFRNATEASFTAHQVDLELLLADTKAYFKSVSRGRETSFNGKLGWSPPSLQNPSQLFTEQTLGKYASKQVADWKLALTPRENHWDRRVDVETPLTKPGLYVVTVAFNDQKQSTRCLVWIQNTAIDRKPLDNKTLYFVANAEDGKPLANVNVELFGYRGSQNQQNRGPIYEVKSFAKKTDANGQLVLTQEEAGSDYQWIVVARDKDRFASLGMEWIGYQVFQRQLLEQVKAYGVSDRPVYRPGDTIKGKLWLARATYNPEVPSVPLANESFVFRLIDPQGTSLVEKTIKTDKYGGFEWEYAETKSAKLGIYTVQVMGTNGQWVQSEQRIRIEEYRKPEFEVFVNAPEEPVALGETIRATIKAKYYFGSPVTDATAVIRVQRSAFTDEFYPRAPFDWCYGPGYWWFAYDYDWYPGWSRWIGCVRPSPWWIPNFGAEPPELVLEREVKLDASGEAKIEIDTAIAKAFQADQDHRYSISVEVRDASRRTIDASGQVIAARQPFKIYSWLDRGYYRVNDAIQANFHARTSGGKNVQGKGKLELFRITYDAERQPQEQLVQAWDVATNEEGTLQHVLKAGQGGQYRLRLKLTDAANHEIEGAYVFTVRGERDKAADFRFDKIELVPDRQHYKPGQKVALQINADRENATVLLFVKPENGVYPAPQMIKLEGRSKIVEIPIGQADQPNFFVEAMTVYEGRVHHATREILVPPESRMLQVTTKLDKSEYRPGDEASVDVQVTDPTGEPVVGSTVVAVYDRSVEAIGGDVLPGDIRAFFWKWRKSHYAQSMDNLRWVYYSIGIQGIVPWVPLGIFGDSLADDADNLDRFKRKDNVAKGVMRFRSGGPGGMPGGPYGGGMAEGMAMSMARGSMGGMGGADAKMAMNAAPAMDAAPMADMAGSGGGGGGAIAAAPAKVRKDFADTAFWVGNITTNAEGRANLRFKMPENLTSWKVRTWVMGDSVRVGSSEEDTVTRKNLLVRLQMPRFLVERDQVTMTSLVNNDLDQEVAVQVRLEIDGQTQLKLADGESIVKEVRVASHGQARVDWKCIALAEGEVIVRTVAESALESDAMQLKLPILVHGFLKTDSLAGTVRPDQAMSFGTIRIPESRRVEQSRLVVRLSPSLAASMIDALPYMVDYPYGCTEQTLNRFLPTVITQRVLQQMNVDLASLAKKRSNLNAQELGGPEDRRKQWKRFDRNPVYDEQEVIKMVEEGLRKLTEMQNGDGGWGWFSGVGEQSWPHTTAVVVRGLLVAQKNDCPIVPDVLDRGLAWLEQYQAGELQKIKNAATSTEPYKSKPDNLDALVFHILVDAGRVNSEMQTVLYDNRLGLSVYSKALLAIATHRAGNAEQTSMLRRNIEQFLEEDAENETAWLRDQSSWWYWYGSEIEAAATYLKLLAVVEPNGRVAPRLVKYLFEQPQACDLLVEHSRYGACHRSVCRLHESDRRNARQCDRRSLSWEARLGSVEFTPENMFEVDNTITIAGNAVPAGEHRLEVRRQGSGPIYWNAYSTNFTTEEEIAAAGLEVKVDRKYYLMKPVKKDLTLAGDRGQIVEAQRSGFERTEIVDLTAVPSGSMVEVELLVTSKNDYEYILLEDFKAASLEPTDVQSGYQWNGGLSIYREFRDQKVSFFLRALPQGTHSIRYRLRAEAPGTYTALPTVAQGMYAPELVGSSTDFDVRIEEEVE